MKKPELLAPAGSFEKAKTAFLYGADAVYAGTSSLSLRTRAEMKDEDLAKTIEYAHEIVKNNSSLPTVFSFKDGVLIEGKNIFKKRWLSIIGLFASKYNTYPLKEHLKLIFVYTTLDFNNPIFLELQYKLISLFYFF